MTGHTDWQLIVMSRLAAAGVAPGGSGRKVTFDAVCHAGDPRAVVLGAFDNLRRGRLAQSSGGGGGRGRKKFFLTAAGVAEARRLGLAAH